MDDLCLQYEERSLDLVALDEALETLAKKDEQLSRIVELRFFGGLENARIAEVIGCSVRTVERGWKTARAWLSLTLGGAEGLA
jgi:RNA polymerase sigma factor (sigma-70 family)